jgi:hypothetical protein
METMEHTHEHLDEYRKKMVNFAYKHYTLPEFKLWAADTCVELAQQISRINSDKCDKEELMKTMLMTEDICSMLRMLLHKEADKLKEISSAVYCEFAEMLKTHGVAVEGCSSYVVPAKIPPVQANSLN